MYERTTHGTAGATEHVQFLYAGGAHGGNAFALRVVTTPPAAGSNSSNDSQDNPPPAMRYQHFDHLGSVTASTDENGRVVGALGGAQTTVLGYDAWGARRNPDGRPATTTLALQPGHREFTGHETIPDVGLVNMNGRVYDPELGRFLTPDPTVQFVADLQSYNRYSYVLNNPLRYTDPTGYAWYSFLSSSSFWIGLGLGTFDAIACVGTGGAGCIAMTALTVYYQTSTMLVSGAPFDQVAATTLFGFGAGMVGGAIGGGIAGWLGANPAYQIVGGAIAGMVSGGLTTLAFGGNLGQNMLLGAASGALAAAAAWGAQGTNTVSQASADQSQGGGGSIAEKVETVDSILAAAGYTGPDPIDQILLGVGVTGVGVSDDDLLDLGAPRRLTYNVVVGATTGPNGELVDYRIQWGLTEPSNQGGWIVQNLRTRSAVMDAWGTPMPALGNFAPGNGYCEAWPVAPGATGTGDPGYDDQFSFAGGGPGTHGRTSEIGVARFYEGLELPSAYVPGNIINAGSLYSTWTCPPLPLDAATAPVVRSVSVSW